MTTATSEELRLTDRINRIEPSATMTVVAEADKLRSQGIDVVGFGAGEPHFSTPQHIKEAAIAAIQENFTKYTPVAGTAELRDAIAHRHNMDFDSDYRREEVIASVGGKQALFNAIQVLVDHRDEVILPVPYWVSFKDIVRYAGGDCVLLETDENQGFRVTAEMVARLISPRTKAIILNSPSNPSGAVMSPEDMTEVVRLAHQRGIWVLSDECYVYLNYAARNFSVGALREYKERFVLLGSLSKTYAMTGWRVGFAHGPAEIIQQMIKLQQYTFVCAPQPAQWAAAAALDVDMQSHVAAYRQKRNRLVEALSGDYEIVRPGGAFYMYPRAPWGTASEFVAEAIRNELLIIPGNIFSRQDTHFRISYAAPDDVLERGIEVLLRLARSGE